MIAKVAGLRERCKKNKTDNFNIANNFQIKKRFTNTEETCGGGKKN